METFDADFYLTERYLDRGPKRSRLVSAYYTLKPIMPHRLQLSLRRLYARRQSSQAFPAWPIESILVDQQQAEFRRRIEEADGAPVPFVNFWPDGARAALTLTHDVEGPAGIELIERVRSIERKYGFASAWYFVAEDYEIPDGLFERLRREGCEVGLHGIKHDAKLFSSRAAFDAELPKIHRYLNEWEAVGFRSPATHRNAEWMPELGCLYDTTFSDTAPFEPQSGGCCSIQPYFLGDLVELPMTLVMDHTLWEILRDTSANLWIQKAEWVIANHGLINLLVHPDYVTSDERLSCYETFLAFLASQQNLWAAVPCEVASWWKLRATLDVAAVDGGAADVGGLSLAPGIAYAQIVDDAVSYEPAGDSTRTGGSR